MFISSPSHALSLTASDVAPRAASLRRQQMAARAAARSAFTTVTFAIFGGNYFRGVILGGGRGFWDGESGAFQEN